MPIPILIRPRSSNMLNASRRDSRVRRSALGELDPSTARKMGSRPPVARNRDWKKGLLGSVRGPPEALMVREKPKRFGTRISLRLLSRSSLCASARARSDSAEAVVRFASAPHPDHRTTSADAMKVKPRYRVNMCSPPVRVGRSESVTTGARRTAKGRSCSLHEKGQRKRTCEKNQATPVHASTHPSFRHHARNGARTLVTRPIWVRETLVSDDVVGDANRCWIL